MDFLISAGRPGNMASNERVCARNGKEMSSKKIAIYQVLINIPPYP